MDEAMRGIEALRRRDEAASKAYDVKALAELWTQDAVALPPGGPVKRGPELRAGLARMAEAAKGTEVLDYREVFEETLVFGDTAVEWGHIEGSERDRATRQGDRQPFPPDADPQAGGGRHLAGPPEHLRARGLR